MSGELLTGTVGDDTMNGGRDADTLAGASGDDTLRGGAGDDALDGGAGRDVARFGGAAGGYAIGVSGGRITVTDIDPGDGDDGSDTLAGIELLRFADRILRIGAVPEELVGAPARGPQDIPAVAVLSDGRQLVSWHGSGIGDDAGIFARLLGPDGQPLAPAFAVNSTLEGGQYIAGAAALAGGGFVIVWHGAGSTDDSGIWLQRYAVDGTRVGGEVRVNNQSAGLQYGATVTALDDGGFVVAWQGAGSGDDSGAHARIYRANGAALGPQFGVNEDAAGVQGAVTAAELADGSLMLAWVSTPAGGGPGQVVLRHMAADGSALGASVVADAEATLSQRNPTLVALAGGGFVVAWETAGGGDTQIVARVHAADGSPLGEAFAVNGDATGEQRVPALAALADGGFVVAWHGAGSGDEAGIFAQRFAADGSTLGGEFRLNAIVVDTEDHIALAARADGGFFAAWVRDVPGAASFDIIACSYDAEGGTVLRRIVGGGGDDRIDLSGPGSLQGAGRAGNDTYVLDSAADSVREGEGGGHDTVIAGVDWRLGAQLEDLVLAGGALRGTGNALQNRLTGNAGANTLDGGAGADTLAGGEGGDLYRVDNRRDAVLEAVAGSGRDRIEATLDWVLGAGIEDLSLNGGNAIAGTGNVLANRIDGSAADNVLDGGAGADTLAGGRGDDTYRIDDLRERLIEHAGEGIDTVESSVSWQLGADFELLSLQGGAGDIDGTGNAQDNELTGNAGANRLAGGAGDDVLDGRAGADTLDGGNGDDAGNWLGLQRDYRFERVADGDLLIIDRRDAGDADALRQLETLRFADRDVRLGSEFGVEGSAGTQPAQLSAALHAQAGSALVWRAQAADGSAATEIIVQVAASPAAEGIQTRLGGTQGDAHDPAVIASADGFLVVWLEDLDGGGTAIEAQRVGANGQLEGEVFRLGTNDGAANLRAVALADGGFALAWLEGGGAQIVAARFDAEGARIADAAPLAAVAGSAPALAALPDGGFLLGWSAQTVDGERAAWQRFDADGQSSGDLFVAASSADAQAGVQLATLADGGFVMLGEEIIAGAHHLFARRFDAAGAPVGDAIDIGGGALESAAAARLAALADGGFVVAWRVLDEGGAPVLMQQRFDTDGVGVGLPVELPDELGVDAGSLLLLSGMDGGWWLGHAIGGETGTAAELAVREFDADGIAQAAHVPLLIGTDSVDLFEIGGAVGVSGGAGSDLYTLTAAGVRIIEAPGGGTDSVTVSFEFTLPLNVERLVLVGSAPLDGHGNVQANRLVGNLAANRLHGRDGADTLDGGAGDDRLFGGAGDDFLAAGDGQDVLRGGHGGDTLTAGAGDDELAGGGGADRMFGDTGADVFVFATPLAAGNVDSITDFAAGIDVLALDDDIFTALGAAGTGELPPERFLAGDGLVAAQTPGQRIVYDSASGGLYYDADGVGGVAAVRFATLGTQSHPALLASDIVIVG